MNVLVALVRALVRPRGRLRVGVPASHLANDDVYDLVIWVASTNPTLDAIVARVVDLIAEVR